MDDERDLRWDGMYNVRDLGGLPTVDGGRTRRGALVRSESLDWLDPPGWAALHAHGVRTCVDLRSAFELGVEPYRSANADIDVIRAPLEEGLLDDPEFRSWAESGDLSNALYFEPYLRRWPDRLAAVVSVIARAAPGGVLYHCQRGRDRTGLVTMTLLSLVGVPVEIIVDDHLRTDGRLVGEGIALGHVPLDGEAERYAARGTTARATLTRLLTGLDAERLLLDGGLLTEELASVRARLLE